MLSICIPVYNYNVISLLQSIIIQIQQSKVPIEILVFDDASTNTIIEENNKQFVQLHPIIQYKKLNINIGRASIRNLLAENTNYTYLLFLDCDSKINKNNFLSNYIAVINKFDVVYGGRNYDLDFNNKDFLLHKTYGIKRECKTLTQRLLEPYNTFYTNNFMVKKEILLSNFFNENIKTYGYEDVLWANQLKENKIKIHHIENEIIHEGLDNNHSFIKKSKEASINLAILLKQNYIINSKLVKAAFILKKMHLNKVYTIVFSLFENLALKNLVEKKTKHLIFLDLLKLKYLLKKL